MDYSCPTSTKYNTSETTLLLELDSYWCPQHNPKPTHWLSKTLSFPSFLLLFKAQSTIWFSFLSSPLIFLFSLFSPMVLWNTSLSLWTKSSSNGGAEVRERRFMEEQGNGFADPPQGPFQSRRRPSPPPPGSSFRRRRRRRRRLLLYHLRPVAPTVQRFPQGVLAFFFYFLSQKRYFFWFWKFEKNMCDG